MSPQAHAAVLAAAFLTGILIRRLRKRPPSSPDARVVDQLRAAGSDLRKPHDIEFFLYFPAQGGAAHVAEKLVDMGFTTTVKPAEESDLPWVVLATRRMLPEVPELERLSKMLAGLCRAENGEFDGWGAAIET